MISFTIRGQPPRKSNSRRIVYNKQTGKPRLIKSDKALQWVEDAMKQIPAQARQGIGDPKHPVRATFHVTYKTRRSDLSVELVLDMLQQAGVIADDRYVFEVHAYKWIDKELAGVVCELEVMR
jgi:Holliday junction resolvase RusA-like endonuclease